MTTIPPSTTMNLFFRGEKLKDLDTFSKSDPYIVLCEGSVKVPHAKQPLPSKLGRTETVMNELSPTFKDPITVKYYFEVRQVFTILVFDDDGQKLDQENDLIGTVEFQLAHVVGARMHTKVLELGGKAGKIHITAAEVGQGGRDTISIDFIGTQFVKMDTFGSADPYFKIHRILPNRTKRELYQSEVINNTLQPNWNPTPPIRVSDLFGTDPNEPTILFECFDKDMFSSDEMGSITCSFNDLMSRKGTSQQYTLRRVNHPKKKNKVYGQILIGSRTTLVHKPSFTEFLGAGWQINLAASIDFTGSNGDPRTPQSLHYMDPNHPNQYVKAIMSVGDILMEYDTDKQVPAFGFGAMLPDGQVSHFFHLNLGENPYVNGVQGLLDAYGQCLTAVRLYGPTNFAPTIRNVVTGARTAGAQMVYTILLILTDGEITDMDHTIKEIVDADDAPISIIIVGVGNGCDFRAMDELDADGKVLRSTYSGKMSRRDLVQFVPFRDFVSKPGFALAAEVLREVPDQFERFVEIVGVPLPASQPMQPPPPQQQPPQVPKKSAEP